MIRYLKIQNISRIELDVEIGHSFLRKSPHSIIHNLINIIPFAPKDLCERPGKMEKDLYQTPCTINLSAYLCGA
jgi:hypothetical protein